MALPASFLDQLSTYVAANVSGLNATGASVNVFVGRYPGTPDNLVAFLGNLGVKPNIDVGALEYPRLQIVVRNTDFITGETLIRAIRTLLHDKLAIALTNFYCYRIQAESDIIPLGEDDQGRNEFSINFSAQIRYGDSIT